MRAPRSNPMVVLSPRPRQPACLVQKPEPALINTRSRNRTLNARPADFQKTEHFLKKLMKVVVDGRVFHATIEW